MSDFPRAVHAPNLPKPVGPYSPGMALGRLIFVSGQGATDPATGRLAGADVESQTEQCLKNVRAILQAAGSDLPHVLRCGVFLIDMAEFPRMNAVYERVFAGHRPARTTIQAAALPGDGLRVEIDCIAYVP
jgi:2-iminobutanoate/2-iminopropanoate deaminase